MQVELLKDWRGFRAGHVFALEAIGGGVYDILQRNDMARLLSRPVDSGAEQNGGAAHDPSRDATNQRAGDNRGSQNATAHRRKR